MPTLASPTPPKWDVLQRLALIEATVYWTGRLGSQDLIDAFGISRAQASKDLASYQARCPRNLLYDRTLKRYVPSRDFRPAFLKGGAHEFLELLRSSPHASGGVLALLGELPPYEIVEPLGRTVDPQALAVVVRAIYARRRIVLRYQSMSRGEIARLYLEPHALVHNGFRWHMRAFSLNHEEYRDFVLARMRSVPEITGPAEAPANEDIPWNTRVLLRIGANPQLSDAQRAAIEDDYGMQDGELQRELRAAVVPYFLRLMGLHPREAKGRRGELALLNHDDVARFVSF